MCMPAEDDAEEEEAARPAGDGNDAGKLQLPLCSTVVCTYTGKLGAC